MKASRTHPHDRSCGFTLLEVMVVMVIVSVVLTFAVLSVDTGSRELENETRRLAALCNLASEETIMNSREYKVVFQQNGYSFFRFKGGGEWSLIETELLRPRSFPEGYTVLLSLEGEQIEVGDEPGAKEKPAIYFLSSGEVTPFEVELVNSSGESSTISNSTGFAEVVNQEG